MSYHIYTTDGIILKRSGFGEANILLYILTSDLGLIIASARSARLSSSKLRTALQEYEHVSVSCIKGKNGWKITNVVEKGSFFFENQTYSRKVLAQVGAVLLKMIPGESPHPEIFKTVKSGFDFLKTLEEKYVSSFEILIVFRIMRELGYVVSDANTEVFLKDMEDWNVSLLEVITEKKTQIVELINKALKESQL